jgi:hypothetical protein
MRRNLLIFGFTLLVTAAFSQQSAFVLNKQEYFAGDYDLRVESQSSEAYILTMAYEAFGIKTDETSFDQNAHLVEIHQPDGKNDVLQQIEHDAITVVGGYKSMERLYCGIIAGDKRQYVMLDDGSTVTDGLSYDGNLKTGERTGTESSVPDDRWVFTEDNPSRALPKINDPGFTSEVRSSLKGVSEEISWGAGLDIQSFGVRQYFLCKAFPDIFSSAPVFNALNFILGVHPGENTSSFASCVGVRSATLAYGVNRADESYIPGGVASGTALIRPDFPELLDWPYLWQQQEYVLGGGYSNNMLLVLAADQLLTGK